VIYFQQFKIEDWQRLPGTERGCDCETPLIAEPVIDMLGGWSRYYPETAYVVVEGAGEDQSLGEAYVTIHLVGGIWANTQLVLPMPTFRSAWCLARGLSEPLNGRELAACGFFLHNALKLDEGIWRELGGRVG
jgi:hypothetical protein